MTDFDDSKDNELINQLAAELGTSSRPVLSPLVVVSVWLIVAVGVSVAAMYLVQPFRPGLFSQWLSVPLFTLETVLGAVAILGLSLASIRSAVPGEVKTAGYIGVVALLSWILVILSGYIEPVMAPSMEGKREHCHYEALRYSIPLCVALSMLVWRRYSLRPSVTALYVSLTVVLIPAFLMQLSCMHEVNHAVTHHLWPALLVGVVMYPLVFLALRLK